MRHFRFLLVGIVTDVVSQSGVRPLIAPNIGAGPALDDVLFAFDITGHYRYLGPWGGYYSKMVQIRVALQSYLSCFPIRDRGL